MRRNRTNYEPAWEYTADAYTVEGQPGTAWHVLGWEIRPDEVTAISETDYFPECGQIGCGHGR